MIVEETITNECMRDKNTSFYSPFSFYTYSAHSESVQFNLFLLIFIISFLITKDNSKRREKNDEKKISNYSARMAW